MTKSPRYQHSDSERRYAQAYARLNGWIMIAVSIVFVCIALAAFAGEHWLYGTLLLIFISMLGLATFISLQRLRRRNR